MRDSAFWKSSNHNGFVNLQVLATPRLELFATAFVNQGEGTIGGLMFDPSILPQQPAGLDFVLQSTTMPGFSDLKVRQAAQAVGANYRVSENLMFNAVVQYDDYKDKQPYLFDATGRRVSFMAGVNWIF